MTAFRFLTAGESHGPALGVTVEGVPAGQRVLVVQGPGFLDLRVASVQVRANETAALIVELEVTPNFLDRIQVTATRTPLSIGDLAAQLLFALLRRTHGAYRG